eukprot:IDg23637t1
MLTGTGDFTADPAAAPLTLGGGTPSAYCITPTAPGGTNPPALFSASQVRVYMPSAAVPHRSARPAEVAGESLAGASGPSGGRVEGVRIAARVARSGRKPGHRTALLRAAAAGCAALTVSVVAMRMVKNRGRKRVVPKYKRAALMRPFLGMAATAWKWLLTYGGDADFIVSINVTKSLLIERILPHFESERRHVNFGGPYRTGASTRGRPAQLRSIDVLGLVLWFLKCRNPVYRLCPVFGIVPSSIHVWLDYGLEVLTRVVRRPELRDFEIRWPTEEEMRSSSALLEHNRQYGHLLRGVFAVLDGGRMPCASYVDADLQNAYWEGFTQAVEVTNLFVWNFHGEIVYAALNFPGSWHDSKLAVESGLYVPHLTEHTPPGYAILGDSAFPRSSAALQGKLVRARKVNEHNGADVPHSAYLAAVDALLERSMPSERQSAEWGVRAHGSSA